MRLTPSLVRLSALAVLVLTSAVGGGWKWEHFIL
jgi:hypothetical protein